MRRILTAVALSSLFAAAPAFAHKHMVSKRSTPVVAGDAKPAEAKPAEGGEAKPAEAKPAKTKKKTTKKTEAAPAPAEGAPAK